MMIRPRSLCLVGFLLLLVGLSWRIDAFSPSRFTANNQRSLVQLNQAHDGMDTTTTEQMQSRRQTLKNFATTTGVLALSSPVIAANAETLEEREKQRQYIQESYDDFTKTNEGWLYREVKPGSGERAQTGDRVVFDWSGYTIGYFGRPFQAKGGPQGGAFDKDLDYERTVIGSGKMVQGLELALKDMQPGAVRQVIIPYGKLSYPEDDPDHDRVGPKPATFSGQRALNFVLDNPRLDRTLLFNVKVIRVDKSNGKGGFIRG